MVKLAAEPLLSYKPKLHSRKSDYFKFRVVFMSIQMLMNTLNDNGCDYNLRAILYFFTIYYNIYSTKDKQQPCSIHIR